MDLDRFFETLEPEGTKEAGKQPASDALVGLGSDEDLRAEIFVQTLHPRSQIDALAHSGIIHPFRAAEITDVGDAGVKTEARLQRMPIDSLGRKIAETQGGFASAQLMVGLQVRRVPESEDGIPEVFDDGTIGGMDALGHSGPEVIVHYQGKFVGIHAFGEGSEAGNVAE